MRLRLVALATFFLLATPAIAAPDELARLNAQIINNPTDIELNLRYARLAEQRGEPRKALAAYERVLIYDPNNVEAKSGLDRSSGTLPTVADVGRPLLVMCAVSHADGTKTARLIEAPGASIGLKAPQFER